MYQRFLILFVLFPFLAACSDKTVNTTANTQATPVTPLSAEQENQRRKLAHSFTVAGMHLGMDYVRAKSAATGYLTTIDEQDKPFRLKEADYVNREAAFYDQRYAALSTNFYAYYGNYNIDYPNGVQRTYDRARIRADFVPAMVWSDEQPLYLYSVTQAICPHSEEELNHIISAVLNEYGLPNDVVETGPKNRIQRLLDPIGRGIDRHYIWRLNSTGPTRFDGNPGYVKNGMRFYDDLVLTLTHQDIRNWNKPECDDSHNSKLQLSLIDELYHARFLDLHNAYVEAGFPDSEQTRRLIDAKKAQSGN